MSNWTILRSSNIRACRYDRVTPGKTGGTLLIQFVSGAVWMYWPVSWKTYMKFRRSKSHGSFFSSHIRDSKELTSLNISGNVTGA
jgi:hypothetical protein